MRIEINLICMSSKVVLLLIERLPQCHHLFATGTELTQRLCNLFQQGNTRAGESIQIEHDQLDARVIFGAMNGFDHIAQLDFKFFLTRSLCDHSIQWPTTVLLNQFPLRCNQ